MKASDYIHTLQSLIEHYGDWECEDEGAQPMSIPDVDTEAESFILARAAY